MKLNTDSGWRAAESAAGVCREFDRLMADGAHSLRTAAVAVGKSASWFSGADSPYQKFQREGLAGLLPAAREGRARALAVPEWFVPAARFFYLISNRTFNSGSVPEAVRRTISLPHLPTGWTQGHRTRLCRALGLDAVPECPVAVREQILARQAAGQPLVTARLARQILVNPSVVQRHRSPRNWQLANLSAPGSQRRYTTKTGERKAMAPGDFFGGDDATPGIAVCVPVDANAVRTPTSLKFGVLLGRFQWLAYHDGATDQILAWDHVIRPRGSYRAEDILNGMAAVVKAHGVPRLGWQFEGGTFNARLVRQAITLMGCEHWRTNSPHQKAIESVFNRVWTRLAVQFPHADMGRFREENEINCKLYEACKAGHQDPRRYLPALADVVKVFAEEVAAHNAKAMQGAQYGRWTPAEFFAQSLAANPLRPFSPEMDWIFSPFSVERTVHGMLASCRVPMFEGFSVPFDFGADWLPLYNGKKVRLHFNPHQPKCVAKVVLLENANGKKAGDILGDARLIGETASYIRYVLDWADDDQRAGCLQRQKTNNYLQRVTRAVGVGRRVTYAASEERDGVGGVRKLEQFSGELDSGGDAPAGARPGKPLVTNLPVHNGRADRPQASPSASIFSGGTNSGSDDPGAGRPGNPNVSGPLIHCGRAARSESSPAALLNDEGRMMNDETGQGARSAPRISDAEIAELEARTAHLFT